jgi:hypothetical protein
LIAWTFIKLVSCCFAPESFWLAYPAVCRATKQKRIDHMGIGDGRDYHALKLWLIGSNVAVIAVVALALWCFLA